MADKAQKKTTKKNPRKKTAGPAPAADLTAALRGLDTAQLGESVRVYTLAKKLGVTSRDLIAALGDAGMKKVAQSSLTNEEVRALVDKHSGSEEEKPAKKSRRARSATRKADAPEPAQAEPAAEDEEKIKDRVRKNVANEIHQIEEKVEQDLAQAAKEAAEETDDDTDLADIIPEITPAPETDDDQLTAAFTPLFVAPGTDEAEDLDVETLEETAPRRSRRRSARHVDPAPAEQTRSAPEDASDDTEQVDEPVATKGSTRLEAQRRRRTEMREAGRKRKHIVSQAEFLARRESVERTMVVRERARHDGPGQITEVGVLEDDLLVEHFVTSEAQASMIGNIYLGRVQNVLASMEAAFIDIGTGRNGVLYASEIDWKTTGTGSGRSRKVEQILKSGDQVLVQVSKDPLGHKGPRLTTQISLAGRFLVYVPNGRSAGISRKLPAPERKRLKDILSRVIPGKGGAIIRTAAENVSEEAIGADVSRLHDMWEDISRRAEKEKSTKGSQPVTLYEEPDMLVKVVRDLFNEDFAALVVDGKRSWNTVSAYVNSVAPDLADRLERFHSDDEDAFERYRIDEQIQKALAQKVWLPSGGYLIIEQTEAMVVIDVNTGKFTGSGGNLEETVTRNNLEAAEEIVRQMRLRDLGGMIVVDFIDMVLPENRDLVLRRLKEALGRDRTRHQVSEVTSLGLVQITRKRLGTGLLETFATECPHCEGRGLILHDDPVDESGHDEHTERRTERSERSERKNGRGGKNGKDHGKDHKDHKDAAPAAQHSSQEDLEKIAASVVSFTDEDDAPEQSDDSHDGGDQPRRRGRRGRRGAGRGRGQSRSDAPRDDEPVSEVEKIAAAAVERAGELDPDEPSGADYIADEKSFQDAVAEFEASPRRRRKTRGNSRSDQRPRREDYAEKAPDRGDRAEQAEPEKPRKKEEPAPAAATRGRGRRRVVRRMTDDAASQAESGQRTRPEAAKAQPEKEKAGVDKRNDNRSRGRRRATRRSSRRG